MSTKLTTVRIAFDGEHFEILVHPDNALNFRLGRNIEVSQVVAADEIYSDASKGQRVPEEKLNKYFRTTDPLKVAEVILKRGDLQLTAEQRKRLVEDKRRQIVNMISRDYVDPRTMVRHPLTRIEQAMQEARVSIDPFKDAAEQAKMIVDQLRGILPLKSENLKLLIRVPARFAPQALGALKGFGELQRQDWGTDGSLTALIVIPSGVHSELLEKIGSITKGSAEASTVR